MSIDVGHELCRGPRYSLDTLFDFITRKTSEFCETQHNSIPDALLVQKVGGWLFNHKQEMLCVEE